MRAFSNFLAAKRNKTIANGAKFVFREIIGGIAHIVQTELPTANGGGTVPQFTLSSTGGIYSTASNGVGFFLNLDNVAFNAEYAEFQASLDIEPVLSPESIAAGATLGDLTNATATDIANVNSINALKAVLSMG